MIDLAEKYLEILRKVLCLYLGPGTRVYLHGSRANGTAWKYSDIDLAIDSPYPVDLPMAERIRDAISMAGIPYRVDVTDLKADLNPVFRENLESCKELIFDGNSYIFMKLSKNSATAVLADAEMAGLSPGEFIATLVDGHYAERQGFFQKGNTRPAGKRITMGSGPD
ncbi:MAG: nucleotidyltransferase domain-containing protein [Puniceicoccales bacterium]|jgi:type I restriction enzyme S subunit|nr:nucleotidyltransferase domain-containing protein [Puniceicoccales bacterium]